MIGKRISRYKVIEKLGGGGMGVVYKARDSDLDRLVALKFLPPHLSNDEQAKSRFIHEAKTASALDHPNICTIHEIGESDDGQLFIAMAYYKGKTLKKELEDGPLPIEEAVKYTVDISEGLERAHHAGIIHRDIKPANVIVTYDDRVKIVDFGLAKMQNIDLTKSGSTLGTAAYMSPEQAQGGEVDARTDIWSLGVVLYEMLTGKRPFRGEYEQAVIYDILNSDPTPLKELRPDVPEGLAKVVDRMLRKEPADRYENIRELLSEFQQMGIQPYGKDLPLLFFRQDSNRWTRNLAMAAVAGLVVLGIILVQFFFPSQRIPFAERDWILVTDFKNDTGEEIFNHSLNTAITVSIGQSKYVNVFPERRVRRVLQRMEKELPGTIDAELGSEIAQREGVPIVLVPGISRAGDKYALTTVLQDAETGEMLESELVVADGKDAILDALDKVTVNIRRDLGETVAAINSRSKPLVQVTTGSLDALKQYSLGIEKQRNGLFEEAKTYFERALLIDSTFTSARASLGMLHLEMANYRIDFDADTGLTLLKKAVRHVETLTDLEKYSILAFHAQMVNHDLEQAADYYESLIDSYPDHSHAHNNLGRVYRFMGRYDEAISEFKKAIRMDPSLTLAYNNINLVYLYSTGNIDSAYVWCKRQISEYPDYYLGYDMLGWTYVGMDSLDQAEANFERALELNPGFINALYRLGHIYRLQGDYKKAINPISRILEKNPANYYAHQQLGILYDLLGDEAKARQHFEKYRDATIKELEDRPGSASLQFQLARVFAYLGEIDKAGRLEQKALKSDSTLYFDHARLLSILGDHNTAIDKLEQAVESGYSNYVWIKVHPDLLPLYDNLRFNALLDRKLKI